MVLTPQLLVSSVVELCRLWGSPDPLLPSASSLFGSHWGDYVVTSVSVAVVFLFMKN